MLVSNLRARIVESWSLWMLLVIAAIWLYRTPYNASDLDIVPDSVEYAIGALQIHDSGRYEIIVQGRSLPSRYPPWFSALVLLPAYLLFGDEPGNGILPVTLFAVAGIGFAWTIGKRVSSTAGAVLAALAVLAIPTYGTWATKIMTDVPCTALMLASGLLYLRVRSGAQSTGWFLAAGTLAALTTLFRPVSAAVILPFLLIALTKRPGAIRLSATLLLPIAAAAMATLVYNFRTFGSPLRNGYHFWTAVPSDYPALVFSLAHARQTLVGVNHTPFFLFAAISTAAWLILTIRKKPIDDAARRTVFDVLTFVTLATVPIFLFHLFYFFADDRFHLSMLAGSAVIAGSTVGLLIDGPRARMIVRILLPALLLLSVGWRILAPDPAPERRLATDIMREHTPSNAIIISRVEPVYLDRLVARDSTRKIVPLSRRVEYASKLLVRKRINHPQPAPRNYGDQRAEGLLAGGAEEAVLFVAEEQIPELVAAARDMPVFLETSALRGKKDALLVAQLEERFEFLERAPNLYQLRPRQPD